MTFPETVLPIRNELFIDGAWVDVTEDTRGDKNNITIERAFRSEQGNTLTTDQCSFVLNNGTSKVASTAGQTGVYSNRNPLSPYYKKLPLNTPYRCSVEDPHGVAMVFRNQYFTKEYVETGDKPTLDITGDIDIRGDITPNSWRPLKTEILVGKWESDSGSANRSWYVALTPEGKLQLTWSALGGTTTLTATSSVAVASAGRKAWRVVLDVNNGASGNTTTFYTSDTIGGTWTQLGSTVVKAGTTAIYSSVAYLSIGTLIFGMDEFEGTTTEAYSGSFYRFQLYNSSNTLVADANFGAQAPGTTFWSDGLSIPNNWFTPGTRSSISAGSYRFHGEVSEFPTKWDNTGTDVYSPIVASSVVRRIQQGELPLDGSMLRYMSSKSGLFGYWSLEGNGTSTRTIAATLAKKGAPASILSGSVSYNTDDTLLPASTSYATLDTGTRITMAGSTASNTTVATASLFFSLGQGNVTAPTVWIVYGTGTVAFWTVSIETTTWYVRGFTADGTPLGSLMQGNFPSGTSATDWIAWRMQITTSGGNIVMNVRYHKIGTDTVTSATNSSVSGSFVGRFASIELNPFNDTAVNGTKFAHVALLNTSLVSDETNYVYAANAYQGELAGMRFLRVAALRGLDVDIIGDPADTVPMGPQKTESPTAIMQQCADADGGFIYAARDFSGLVMRTNRSLWSQDILELDYSANHFDGELSPTDDDKVRRNRVTISRSSGTSYTHSRDTGPNNTNSPVDDPEGVGLYEAAYQLNLEDDPEVENAAQYATYLGTWDEIRFPSASVSLHRAPFVADVGLALGIQQLDVGDPFSINNLPNWLPPDPVALMTRGYTEVLSNMQWSFGFSTQSYGPFIGNDLTGSVGTRELAAARNSSLNADITTTATSFTVKTTSGSALWKTGSVGLMVMIGGEQMFVGSISGSSSPQTFSSVSRSVNGIVKAHSADDEVQIVDKFYAAL